MASNFPKASTNISIPHDIDPMDPKTLNPKTLNPRYTGPWTLGPSKGNPRSRVLQSHGVFRFRGFGFWVRGEGLADSWSRAEGGSRASGGLGHDLGGLSLSRLHLIGC